MILFLFALILGTNAVNPNTVALNDKEPSGGPVILQFQIRDYSNPNHTLPHGKTCSCGGVKKCEHLFMKSHPASCRFGFTFVISTSDDSVKYFSTKYVPLLSNGSLSNFSEYKWNEYFAVRLNSKPRSIDVFAHHLGPVLFESNRSLSEYNTVFHADTWVIPLTGFLPAIGSRDEMVEKRFEGQLIGTKLTISYALACSGSEIRGDLMGPNCDLICSSSPLDAQIASCHSPFTNEFSICKYRSGGQVDDCVKCPWGLKDETYCNDYEERNPFETATIILSIACAGLIGALVFSIYRLKARKTISDEEEMTPFANSDIPFEEIDIL